MMPTPADGNLCSPAKRHGFGVLTVTCVYTNDDPVKAKEHERDFFSATLFFQCFSKSLTVSVCPLVRRDTRVSVWWLIPQHYTTKPAEVWWASHVFLVLMQRKFCLFCMKLEEQLTASSPTLQAEQGNDWTISPTLSENVSHHIPPLL